MPDNRELGKSMQASAVKPEVPTEIPPSVSPGAPLSPKEERPEDERVSRRSFLKGLGVLGGSVVAEEIITKGAGIKAAGKLLFGDHQQESHGSTTDNSPKPVPTGSKPTNVPETPTPQPDSPEATKSQEVAIKNIESFFETDVRGELNKWAEANFVLFDEVGAGEAKLNSWQNIPTWAPHQGKSEYNYLNYIGNPNHIKVVPQLSGESMIPTHREVEFLGINLAVYEKGGNPFVVVGFLPNPDLAPKVNGQVLDKFICIFQIDANFPAGVSATYTIMKNLGQNEKAYAFGGNSKEFLDLSPNKYLDRVQNQIGNVIYLLSYENSDMLKLATLGIENKTAELGKFVQNIQENQGWIFTKPSTKLPQDAPYMLLGELQGSDPIIPNL